MLKAYALCLSHGQRHTGGQKCNTLKAMLCHKWEDFFLAGLHIPSIIIIINNGTKQLSLRKGMRDLYWCILAQTSTVNYLSSTCVYRAAGLAQDTPTLQLRWCLLSCRRLSKHIPSCLINGEMTGAAMKVGEKKLSYMLSFHNCCSDVEW